MDAERRQHFEAIAAEVYDPLQRYIRRRVAADDAGDLLSDVLLVIWRRLDDVPADAALPWTYAVARRVLSNHRRGAQRRLHLVKRLEAEPAPTMILDPSESLADPALAQALLTLPSHDQEIIRLWAWEQMEPREIAAALGSTANAVSLRLSRARKKLADELARQDSPPPGHKAERHTEEHQP